MKISLFKNVVVSSFLIANQAVFAQDGGGTKPAGAGTDLDLKLSKAPAPAAEKAPPLPLHTIEGVGGLVITPTAYLVNPGAPGTVIGKPSLSATYVNARQKDVESIGITETFFGRLELGYAASRFGTGSLRHNVQDATGVDIGRDDVYLHNVNLRLLLLPENSFELPFLPAITAGAHFKFNDGIGDINHELGGALKTIGYKRDHGIDYTLTASKTFASVFGRPLLVSLGLRASEGSQLGYAGFGNEYHVTFEGNITYLITDNIGIAYEYRQKPDTFGRIGDLVRPEQDWQTIGLAYVFNPHATVAVGYGRFGNVLDTVERNGVAVQWKYEF
jgi:hypothetical protein